MKIDAIPWAAVNRLFTVVMVLDRDLNIIQGSDVLRRYLPQVADSPPLHALFEIVRPAGAQTFEEMKKQPAPLYLMVSRDGRFAVRGQIIDPGSTDGEVLCFLGAPWLSWLHDKNPDLKVGLNDFAAHDAQMDQLFYISSEKRMVEDLEGLNEQLRATTEELRATQEAKSAFFAQMSHELRTPLNGVVSALTLLRDEGLTGKAETLLGLAGESSRNLMQVINYVLDVSKLELSQPAKEVVSFDLPDMVASVTSVVAAKAVEKGLALNSHIDGRLSSAYLGDVSLLRQCLLNLVTNAVKFTDRGEVDIRAIPARHEGMMLRIEVADTGIGIAPKDQDMVFEPFRRVQDAGDAGREPGTGLGLDIVRRNVEHMGGRLGLDSTPGEGSMFWLELPCEAVAPEHRETPEANENAESLRLNGRVLLVDDNETNLMLGEMLLQSVGLEVVRAASGEEAVALAREANLDLVLMDISMPGIDGFEATRRIRVFRDSDILPIVALSAYASSTEREMSETCGMDGYLTKPIVMDELVETLATWLPRADDAPSPDAEPALGDDAASAVDRQALDNLARQIGADNLTKAVNAFLEEADWRWAALEAATTREKLALEAHTLASSCRTFGLPAVGEKIACIEQHAKFGEAAGEPPCINATGQELLLATQALKATMRRYQADD